MNTTSFTNVGSVLLIGDNTTSDQASAPALVYAEKYRLVYVQATVSLFSMVDVANLSSPVVVTNYTGFYSGISPLNHLCQTVPSLLMEIS